MEEEVVKNKKRVREDNKIKMDKISLMVE